MDQEWDLEEGCLGQLRLGQFDLDKFERLIWTLEDIQVDDAADALDRRFVAVTWYIPLFISWQIERCQAQGEDVQPLLLIAARIQNQIERLLGVP